MLHAIAVKGHLIYTIGKSGREAVKMEIKAID
jgi:hypothetical protein